MAENIEYYMNQIMLARTEIKNLRQRISALKQEHLKEIKNIKSTLHGLRCDNCAASATTVVNNKNEEEASTSDNVKSISFIPLGYIETPFENKHGVPRQSSMLSDVRGAVVVDTNIFNNPDHALSGLEEFSHMCQMWRKGAAGRITKKKTISLETKLDILRRFDKGEKAVKIAKAVGLAATTVRTIRDRDGDKIRKAAKSATSLDAKMMTRTRSALMIKMESLLSIWIENQVAQGIPLSKKVIQKKAKGLFDDIKSKAVSNNNASGSKNETFGASQGWFERFKVRANLHSIALKGEAASADITAAECYPTVKSINL